MVTDSPANKVQMPGWQRRERWLEKISQNFKWASILVLKLVVNAGTLPYYRMFQFNTYQPIVLIAAYTSSSEKLHKLLYHVDRWRTRKLAELQFISIAGAIVAAATIGAFSWNAVINAYWLASAFWYSSLVLSILAILLAAQQVAVLQLLGQPPTTVSGGYKEREDIRRFLPLMLTEVQGSHPSLSGDSTSTIGKWKPRWKMIFVWQCPMMFLSYSVCFFLAGLSIFVCTPLLRGDKWSSASNIAVVYIATGVISGVIFIFASYWIYHYIDLDYESASIARSDTDIGFYREHDRLHY